MEAQYIRTTQSIRQYNTLLILLSHSKKKWKKRKTMQETSGSWTANISELKIFFSYYVDSEEYFKSMLGEEE